METIARVWKHGLAAQTRLGFRGLGLKASGAWNNRIQCRNLIKKPWAFSRVPYMNPTILGL